MEGLRLLHQVGRLRGSHTPRYRQPVEVSIRRPPRFSWRGAFFVALGLVGVGIGINATEYRPFGAMLATLSFVLGASLLGRPARLSTALRPLVGRVVRISAWGEPLPGSAGALYVIETITGFGAGLHIQLFRHDDEESGGILKIAQPANESLGICPAFMTIGCR